MQVIGGSRLLFSFLYLIKLKALGWKYLFLKDTFFFQQKKNEQSSGCLSQTAPKLDY